MPDSFIPLHRLMVETMTTSVQPSQDKWFDKIPAHIRYPGMILFFLLGSVLAQMILLNSALSDGGAQVEPDYYQRSVEWDSEKDALLRAQSLGEGLTLMDTPDGFEFKAMNAQNQPITLAEGEVVLSRPHLSEDVATYALKDLPRGEHQGLKIPRHASETPGLWDITFSFKDAQGNSYLKTFRREW